MQHTPWLPQRASVKHCEICGLTCMSECRFKLPLARTLHVFIQAVGSALQAYQITLSGN